MAHNRFYNVEDLIRGRDAAHQKFLDDDGPWPGNRCQPPRVSPNTQQSDRVTRMGTQAMSSSNSTNRSSTANITASQGPLTQRTSVPTEHSRGFDHRKGHSKHDREEHEPPNSVPFTSRTQPTLSSLSSSSTGQGEGPAGRQRTEGPHGRVSQQDKRYLSPLDGSAGTHDRKRSRGPRNQRASIHQGPHHDAQQRTRSSMIRSNPNDEPQSRTHRPRQGNDAHGTSLESTPLKLQASDGERSIYSCLLRYTSPGVDMTMPTEDEISAISHRTGEDAVIVRWFCRQRFCTLGPASPGVATTAVQPTSGPGTLIQQTQLLLDEARRHGCPKPKTNTGENDSSNQVSQVHCYLCGKPCKTKGIWKDHLETSMPHATYECPDCHTVKDRRFWDHLKDYHGFYGLDKIKDRVKRRQLVNSCRLRSPSFRGRCGFCPVKYINGWKKFCDHVFEHLTVEMRDWTEWNRHDEWPEIIPRPGRHQGEESVGSEDEAEEDYDDNEYDDDYDDDEQDDQGFDPPDPKRPRQDDSRMDGTGSGRPQSHFGGSTQGSSSRQGLSGASGRGGWSAFASNNQRSSHRPSSQSLTMLSNNSNDNHKAVVAQAFTMDALAIGTVFLPHTGQTRHELEDWSTNTGFAKDQDNEHSVAKFAMTDQVLEKHIRMQIPRLQPRAKCFYLNKTITDHIKQYGRGNLQWGAFPTHSATTTVSLQSFAPRTFFLVVATSNCDVTIEITLICRASMLGCLGNDLPVREVLV